MATPEPLSTVSNSTFDTMMDSVTSTPEPNTFSWSNPTTAEKAAARVSFWRARMAGRYLPTISKAKRWFIPQLGDRTACAGGVLAVCMFAAADLGWMIGSTINKTFLGRWNGGYSCMTPFGCSSSSGKPATPTGDTDWASTTWTTVNNGTRSAGSWPDQNNAPYPCGLSVGSSFNVGGCNANNVVAEFTMGTNNWNTGFVNSTRIYNTDICETFTVSGTVTLGAEFTYDTPNKLWGCKFKTQLGLNDAVYAWNWAKVSAGLGGDNAAAGAPPPAHLMQVGAGTTTEAPSYTLYMTPDEWEQRTLDIAPGTADGRSMDTVTSYTPPTPTTGDRSAAKAILTNGRNKSGRRAANCYIDPTSSWCTDGAPGDTDNSNGGNTTSTTSVFVTNFPTTVAVTGTVGITGTISTFNSFILPKPELNETYTDYFGRLRAAGWVGSAIIDATESGVGGLSGYGPSAITRIHVGATGADADPNAWPLNPPVIDFPSPDVHVRVNPGTATPSAGPSCGPTPPAVDLTPITSIPFGSKFPFGIFAYVATALAPLIASPTTPVFDVPISLPGGVLGSSSSGMLHVDLSPLDPYMAMIRLLMSIGIGLTAIYMLASSLLGFRAGSAGGGLEMGSDLGDGE